MYILIYLHRFLSLPFSSDPRQTRSGILHVYMYIYFNLSLSLSLSPVIGDKRASTHIHTGAHIHMHT